jgi:hypothetical protein
MTLLEKLLTYHDNYDVVLKDAIAAYKDKSLDFLGINSKVTELLNTENVEVEIHKTYNDLALRLDTNTGTGMEWEADISSADLLRFAAYNVALTRKFGIPFDAIIITKKEPSKKSYIGPAMQFKPKIINLTKRSGKAALNKIRKNLAAGEVINELEIVFLPLYNHPKMTYEEIYRTIIELLPSITQDKHEQDRLLALSVLIANKFIPDDEYTKIIEVIRMAFEDNKLFKILENAKARDIAKNLLKLGVSVDIVKESVGLSDSDISEIQQNLVQAVNS